MCDFIVGIVVVYLVYGFVLVLDCIYGMIWMLFVFGVWVIFLLWVLLGVVVMVGMMWLYIIVGVVVVVLGFYFGMCMWVVVN